MITLERVIKKLMAGKHIELRFQLNYGIYSRHLLSYDDGFIRDESFVDGSITKTTIPKYKKSFYGKAFTKKAVRLIEEF